MDNETRMMSDRQRLKLMLQERSVRHGEFVLASGLCSDVYVDAKLTTCQAAATPLIGRVFLDKLREKDWQPRAVGGLVIGSDPIVMAIARESLDQDLPIDAFLVRKEPKRHGLRKYLEGLSEARGVDVVIVDDVCSTGGSTKLAIQRARDSGMNVLGAVCLVDREMGARETIEGQLACPFERIFTLSELTEDHDAHAVVQSEEVGLSFRTSTETCSRWKRCSPTCTRTRRI